MVSPPKNNPIWYRNCVSAKWNASMSVIEDIYNITRNTSISDYKKP